MKATIKLEAIGRYNGNPYIAKITGIHKKYEFERTFLNPKTQYKNANLKCSRGVEKWFILDENQFYEMRYAVSWKKTIIRYIFVTNSGDIINKIKEDVILCLKNNI